MSKIMIGTDEVLKVMFGLDEVSSLAMGGETIPITPPTPPAPVYSAMPFTIEALESGTIVLGKYGTGDTYGRSFYVSVNGGPATEYTVSDTGNTALTISVVTGDTISFRASQNQGGTSNGINKSFSFKYGTARFISYGNILSLSYTDYQNQNGFANIGSHSQLFCESKLVSAEHLILPSTTRNHCYNRMFQNCTILTGAPELPAATLTNYCYNSMFGGCSSLNYIKCLATDISASKCVQSWTSGVAAAGTFVKDANTTWPSGGDGIPTGWTVVDA